MKRMKFFLILTLISGCAWLSSCSDDKDGDEPDAPKTAMAVSSMYGGYDGKEQSYYFKDITYDNQGRPASWIEDSDYKVSVSYSSSKIVINGTEELNLANGIVTGDSYTTYSYNDANELIKIKGGSWESTYSWQNGNPVKYDDDEETVTFEYYDQLNVIGNYQSNAFSISFMPGESPLEAAGYYGAVPKNMLKAIYSNGKLTHTFTYSDYNENGYPCTMKIVDSDGDIQTYKFTWVNL